MSIAKKFRVTNAMLSELQSFREYVDLRSCNVHKYNETIKQEEQSGNFSEQYLTNKRAIRDRLAEEQRREADARRETAMAVIEFRLNELKGLIYEDFAVLPRSELVESLRFRREFNMPLSESEVRMFFEQASNYGELALLTKLAEDEARKPNESAFLPKVTFLPPVPPALEIELSALKEVEGLVKTFIRFYNGETAELLDPKAPDAQMNSSQAIAVCDALDRRDNAFARFFDRIEKDYAMTAKGREWARARFTESDRKRIESLVGKGLSYEREERAVALSKEDDSMRELFLKDPTYRKAILDAEKKEADEMNAKINRGDV